MFEGPSRRINLGGQQKTQSRHDILKKAREEREARKAEKLKENASVKIQSFWRRCTACKQRRTAERNDWDRKVVALTRQQKNNSNAQAMFSAESIITLLRQFLFFYSTNVDNQRLQILCRALTASVRCVKPTDNYCYHLLALPHVLSSKTAFSSTTASTQSSSSPASLHVWQLQVRKLCVILLKQLNASQGKASSNTMLLWLLTDTTQWPWVPKLQQIFAATTATDSMDTSADVDFAALAVSTREHLLYEQNRVLLHLTTCEGLYPSLRNAILRNSCFKSVEETCTAPALDKTTIALLFSIAVRPLSLWTQIYKKMSEDDFARVPHQHMPAPSSQKTVYSCAFLCHIFSIPLLQSRLRAIGLKTIINSLCSSMVWHNCVLVFKFVPFLLLKGSSVSFSDWDTFTSRTLLNNEKMNVDEKDTAETKNSGPPVTSTVSVRNPSTQQPFLCSYPCAGWLLGNLLELGPLFKNMQHTYIDYWRALKCLILALPSSAFPTPATIPVLHPHLVVQLNKFQDPKFLNKLCMRLVDTDNRSSNSEIQLVCVLLDALLYRWSCDSADMLNTLVFSTPIVTKLWTSLRETGALDVLTKSASSSSTFLSVQESSDVFSLFCSCYGHLLKILDDGEFFDKQQPFPLTEVRLMVEYFKSLLVRFYWTGNFPDDMQADTTATAGSDENSPLVVSTLSDLTAHSINMNSIQTFRACFAVTCPPEWPPSSSTVAEPDLSSFSAAASSFSSSLVDSMAIPLRKVDIADTDLPSLTKLAASLMTAKSEGKESKDNTALDDDYELDADEKVAEGKGSKVANRLQARVTAMFQQLRNRQARRQFCPPETWLMQEIGTDQFLSELASGAGRPLALLKDIPFVLRFDDRVQILYQKIEQDKASVEGFVEFQPGHGLRARISRDNVLFDGYEQLYKVGKHLKGRVQVQFVDEHGNPEPGVDGGGLFKEFLISALKMAFNAEFGLFRETQETRVIYPNPDALKFNDEDEQLRLFSFVGRLVGKALYDGIQIEAQFANFFMRECLGQWNSMDDLESLDRELHKNIMFLKKYEGDIGDLGLSFSVDRVLFGQTTSVNLVPNGANISVTQENRMRYVYLIADYYLNRQLKRQAKAFISGMYDVLNISWLHMFSSDELKLLISGSPTIDIGDLRNNTNYANGYSNTHQAIKWMWEILESFDVGTRAAFLRFSTSCSRAPLLGFSAMYPRFCVQLVSSGPTEDVLPNSATCMNLLRLPRYFSKERLREKLLYAITSGAGFGLS